MPRELCHLRSGHRADAVAAVVEHEPLAARHPVPAQAQPDLRRERLEHGRIAHRRRRPEHERSRRRDMTARVSVRPTDVADDEIIVGEVVLEPGHVDDRGELRHGRRPLRAGR